ncbi:MAG TPA: hypothetical protein VN667_17045 [Burkholderiales bacterium]|nr:hypothetical protein [Burkholderiales bacterium]
MNDRLDIPGAYRRRIVLQAEGRRVFAALEDDFHHMYVEIAHDGKAVTAASGRSLRVPRDSCPAAAARLQEFVGLPLTGGARGIDPLQHCTHLFDLGRYALVHAQRGGRRQYDITVPDAVEKKSEPGIVRDGQLVMQWQVNGARIAAPSEFACENLFGKVNWKHFEPDVLEAAMLLRRGIWISYGRSAKSRMENGRTPTAGSWMPTNLAGACYSFQPAVFEAAKQIDGSILDFTNRAQDLLAELPRNGSIPNF